MIPPSPDNVPAGANRPQPAAPIYYDLAAMLKANPNLCRVLQIHRASIGHLKLTLTALASFGGAYSAVYAHIVCVNAVDYSVRPPNPRLLMGGPLIEFHEQHPLLANVSQGVPNSDGAEIYDPPVEFGVLRLDQTYVIAGQFAMQLEYLDYVGLDEQTKQHHRTEFQRRVEWMIPYRLKQLKRFTTRTIC